MLEQRFPSGVRLMRRVVRFTRGTPSRASIYERRLLTAAVLMPSSRAALLSLPQVASETKKPSSPGWIPELAMIVNPKLKTV
jgi:hypothetical protein